MSPKRDFFRFATAVTLKIRPMSPNSDQFFVMSQLYMHEHLITIQAQVHKILCRQESVTPTPTVSAPKSMCPPPVRLGGHKYKYKVKLLFFLYFVYLVVARLSLKMADEHIKKDIKTGQPHSFCYLIWVLRPFQEYFTYIEPIVHQRWAKTGEPGEKPPDHP